VYLPVLYFVFCNTNPYIYLYVITELIILLACCE